MVAAVAEGIYGVTRIPFKDELQHIKEVLATPANYEIPCYIALGYPQAIQPIEQVPVHVDERMHFNHW
jgi:hypothetical protein